MRGNKKKHKEMWQYIIDNVDNIFKDYADDQDTNYVINKYKSLFLEGEVILNMCYACQHCEGYCTLCPIAYKAGRCGEIDSAFQMVLKSIIFGDKVNFIKEAERIRDAWK